MGGELLVTLICLSLLSPELLVRAEFTLTVNFINYTNPTGLCAECETKLENVTSADQLTPVCCDDWPFRSDNCDNIGGARCDTRFRWIIRPFGASLETRPLSMPGADVPPYYFTDCDPPGASCPFSEMSTTFGQGSTGFLGVEANPLTVDPRDLTTWNGRVQFFIEAVDSGLPNIMDSLLINLDNLQLGADFTEEMTFTGYHNISHMTMSFRVECAPGHCGPDCTTHENSSNVSACHTNGSIVCEVGRDPTTSCSECLPNRNSTANCTTCLPGFTGQDCTASGSPASEVAGAVVGAVVGVALLAVFVVLAVLVVMMVIRRPRKPVTAVNHVYERTDPPSPADQKLQERTCTGASTQEHNFDNPLYATNNVDNDYSSPWDTRTTGSDKPLVVTSSISTHAVVMRVNSNEPSVSGSKKSSEKNRQVEYAEIDTSVTKRPHGYENTKLRATDTAYDYAEPPNTLSPPQHSNPPQTAATPTSSAESAHVKVGPYEYNVLPGFGKDMDERTFDNTGERGLYRSYSPPPQTEQYCNLGQ